jgi:hypothetical protein
MQQMKGRQNDGLLRTHEQVGEGAFAGQAGCVFNAEDGLLYILRKHVWALIQGTCMSRI